MSKLLFRFHFFLLCYFKFSQLQWNEFKRTYQDYKLFFKFNILIETNQLGQFQLSKERIKRLELIYSLHKTGYTNRGICDCLNCKKLKIFRTNKDYTPKLICMTIKSTKTDF